MINQYALKFDKPLTPNQLKRLLLIVTENRRLKSEKYLSIKDKERCLLSEALLIHVLEKYYHNFNKIQLTYTKYGKPLLKNSILNFNISHSGNWIVCSIGNNPVGVDVEEIRKLNIKWIYKMFSEIEQKYFTDNDIKEEQNLFFKLWTLKESYVKFNGRGLSYSFDRFWIDVRNLIVFDEGRRIKNVSFYSDKLDGSHLYALCHDSRESVRDVQVIDIQNILDI